MQKPFAYSPVQKFTPNLTARQTLIVTVASAILLFLVGFELLHMQYGNRAPVVLSSPSSSRELSTGMPLP
jgi:hypothetical protein